MRFSEGGITWAQIEQFTLDEFDGWAEAANDLAEQIKAAMK